MAGSVNKVILIGRLGRDPETRNLQSGDPVCNISLATSESWKDKGTGERKEQTEWHRVVIFNKALAETAQRFLRKGSNVYLEGTVKTRKWTDKEGAERYSTEIVVPKFGGALTLLDKKGEGESAGGDSRGEGSTTTNGGGSNPGHASSASFDDDIPW